RQIALILVMERRRNQVFPLLITHVPRQLLTDHVGPAIRPGPQKDLARLRRHKKVPIRRQRDSRDVFAMSLEAGGNQFFVDRIPCLILAFPAACEDQPAVCARVHGGQSPAVSSFHAVLELVLWVEARVLPPSLKLPHQQHSVYSRRKHPTILIAQLGNGLDAAEVPVERWVVRLDGFAIALKRNEPEAG